MQNFTMTAKEGRFYMWKQRLIHWAQLVVLIVAIFGGTVGVKEGYNQIMWRMDQYVVWSTCYNYSHEFTHLIPKGTLFEAGYKFDCRQCDTTLTKK